MWVSGPRRSRIPDAERCTAMIHTTYDQQTGRPPHRCPRRRLPGTEWCRVHGPEARAATQERRVARAVAQLEALGYHVTLQPRRDAYA
jgi:hypothetical protein